MGDKPVLIFDFDGTIADSLETAILIFNNLAPNFGFNKIDGPEVKILRNSNPKEILKKLGVSWFSIFRLLILFGIAKYQFGKKVKFLKPIKGMSEVIRDLKKQGFRMGIITINSKKNVEKFLKNNNLHYFNFIYAGGLFSKHKSIEKFIKKHKLIPEQIVYIGDEVRDIEAAHSSGVKIVSVSWGFNSREILQKFNPEKVVDKPVQLSEFLKSVY